MAQKMVGMIIIGGFCALLEVMMHRWTYWLKAKTQYEVHSPMVFDMYRKVLFARLDETTRHRVLAKAPQVAEGSHSHRRDRQYHEMVYKLKEHYGLTTVFYNADEAVLKGGEGSDFGTVKVVRRPHSDAIRELRWKAQQNNTKYRVSIDLYDTGLLLDCAKLHRQHFVLK